MEGFRAREWIQVKRDNPPCHFHAEMTAPRGFAGLGVHLGICRIPLELTVSGYNGKTILRVPRGADDQVEWAMDSSDTDTFVATGFVGGTAEEQRAALQSLANMLKAAELAHEILGDFEGPGDSETVRWRFRWPPVIEQE